jgi:hypothetical protein
MTQEQRPRVDPRHIEDEEEDPMEGGAYGASSAESGGNYDNAGPTAANIDGEPMDADEETRSEPSPS